MLEVTAHITSTLQRCLVSTRCSTPTRPAWCNAASIQHPAEHRLEVARLRHVGQERMVRAGARHLPHLQRAPGVVAGAAQHVEELVLADQAGTRDRQSVVQGKTVSVRVDIGGRSIIKKKTANRQQNQGTTSKV